MEFFLTVRALIAFIVLLFCSLWLSRQLKRHRPQLTVSACLTLGFITVFEPGFLAFLVWAVHEKVSTVSRLMIHAYTFLKAGSVIYLLFIVPSIYFARRFYTEPSLLTLKALRFAMILPVAFAAVVFMEVPKMIWGDYAVHLEHDGWWIVGILAVVNICLIAQTYLRPSKKI